MPESKRYISTRQHRPRVPATSVLLSDIEHLVIKNYFFYYYSFSVHRVRFSLRGNVALSGPGRLRPQAPVQTRRAVANTVHCYVLDSCAERLSPLN